MDLDAKQFTTSKLSAITECEPMTFRTWRNRNGLFPESAGGRTWKRFSVLDLCIVRTIVVMTRQGLGASDAIHYSQKYLEECLASLLQGIEIERYVAFEQGKQFFSKGRIAVENASGEIAIIEDGSVLDPAKNVLHILNDAKSVAAMMADSEGILTVIDLLKIVQHVLNMLKFSDDDQMATRG